jgi:NhaA family Na+:H+ antiporter
MIERREERRAMEAQTEIWPPQRRSPLHVFLESGAAGGVFLFFAAANAMVIANSPLGVAYFAVLSAKVAGLSIQHWINDALMAMFFLLVGLEIKREFLEGQLATWSRRALPAIAALGGMVAPALIYLALNRGNPATCAAGPFPPRPTSPSRSACWRCWARACRSRSRSS